MNSILDSETPTSVKQPLFSYFSIAFALITIIMAVAIWSMIPSNFRVTEQQSIPFWLPIAIDLSCLLGIISSILSFVKREPSTMVKWLGGILNLIMLIAILGSIFFARTR